jgi:hypothetical protein
MPILLDGSTGLPPLLTWHWNRSTSIILDKSLRSLTSGQNVKSPDNGSYHGRRICCFSEELLLAKGRHS